MPAHVSFTFYERENAPDTYCGAAGMYIRAISHRRQPAIFPASLPPSLASRHFYGTAVKQFAEWYISRGNLGHICRVARICGTHAKWPMIHFREMMKQSTSCDSIRMYVVEDNMLVNEKEREWSEERREV